MYVPTRNPEEPQNHIQELKEIIGGLSKPEPRTDVKIGVGGESRRSSDEGKKYDISKMPDELKGLSAVTIPRGSTKEPAPGFTFKASGDSDVYIAVHDRGGYRPPREWKKTDMKLRWSTRQTDAVYSKSFKKGVVVIPSHSGRLGSHYGVPHMAFARNGRVERVNQRH